VSRVPDTRRAIGWIERRRFRYKRHPVVPLEDVRGELKTGDIILFHKTARAGILDTLEMDVLAPLFFEENEFRHSGIVVRRGDDLFVVECTEAQHSGASHASYPTGGAGIREVPLELLLAAYTRDNGDPHFGVRLIPGEIAESTLMARVREIGPVIYLKARRSISIYLSSFFLPPRIHRRIMQRYSGEMMCSEFVHSVLAACGALAEYPSKLFAPYVIENPKLFERYDVAGYSDVVRFVWSRHED
jgi:hypothetical protein